VAPGPWAPACVGALKMDFKIHRSDIQQPAASQQWSAAEAELAVRCMSEPRG